MNIGWIGLGNMGIPMATQLLNAGYRLTVYNRNKAKSELLQAAGATVASNPKSLMERVDILILMVSDDAAISEIFESETGLLNAETKGAIIINMSTVSPDISKKMSEKCIEKGLNYLDAPVSGSVKQAETGQLVIMVGGEEAVYQKAKPILDHLGKLTLRVGEIGSGNHAKLAINSLLALYTQGLAETILFANQNGIETQDLLTLINNAAIGNVFSKIKGDAILANQFKPAFALKHIVKDLRLAKDQGISSPLAQTALSTFEKAEANYGEEDLIAVIKALK